MTTDRTVLFKYLDACGSISSSLRLKDVLDAVVIQYARLAGANKVAVFLADNENKCFRLMAAKGYSQPSLKVMRTIPFTDQGIFQQMLEAQLPILINQGNQFVGFSKTIAERERSIYQLAVPLMAVGLWVGAVLIDAVELLEADIKLWHQLSTITAYGVANAILFGRSEYERERLNTLYKVSCSLEVEPLSMNEILQRITDAALVLCNTPYCALLLGNLSNDMFTMVAFKGLEGGSLPLFNLSTKGTLAAKALQDGTIQLADRIEKPLSGMPKGMGNVEFRSILSAPILYKTEPLGVLQIFSTDEQAFSQEQVELLSVLAARASNALHTVQVHEAALAEVLYDPHTGLLNRLYFHAALHKEVERSKRHHHCVGLLLVDIDYLSRVNDLLGQEKGDETIAELAKIVRTTLRSIDLIYRYGGEQFAIILPETSVDGMMDVAQRLRKRIKSQIISDKVGTMTVSIGASAYPDQGHEAAELIVLAEQALYIAKFQGRDQVVEAQALSTNTESRQDWMQLAKRAKEAVIAERAERAKSHLSGVADYNTWFTRLREIKGNRIEKDHIPLT